MRESVIQQLREITPDKQGGRWKTISMNSVLDSKSYLKDGRLIAITPHYGLRRYPEHRHDYIEIMYVCQGSVAHWIEGGKEILLQKGDMLLMNQYVKHSVQSMDDESVAINFIALPEFFDIPMKMMSGNNILVDFFVSTLRRHHPISNYLLFHLEGELEIENLIENMIITMRKREINSDSLIQYSMGLVFLYLMNNVDNLTIDTSNNMQDAVMQSIVNYIDTHYKIATLQKISEDFHRSMSALSKMIKQKTGSTFQELLQQKRFEKATALLIETNLSIDEIIVAVGYENQSYFYRKYKEKYGMTPREYRIKCKKGK